MSEAPATDATLLRFRDEINAVDAGLLELVNRRRTLVAELWAYKDANAIPDYDPDRERRLLDGLVAANPGPLKPESVEELFRAVLAVIRSDLGRSL